MDALDDQASPMLQLARIADKSISEASLRSFLGSFGFSGERMDTPCQSFSGGERARLALALIVWQRPNVLILDEPTNHLDLDMRHALTMALQDFEGAVVLVSHERQLIATVCDDLLLVHDGRVTDFDGDLQEYSQWLRQARQHMLQKQQDEMSTTDSTKTTIEKAVDSTTSHTTYTSSNSKVDKEAQRKENARRREQTRPLRKKMEQLEKSIEKAQVQLTTIENQLADSAIYEAGRKAELLQLMDQQTAQKASLAQDEEQLLELMMELEELEASFEG